MIRIVLLMVCSSYLPLNASWLDNRMEGWAWYEDRKENDSKEEERVEEKQAPVKSAKERLDEVKRDLDEKLALAVLEPTPENVYAYQLAQQKWLKNSEHFSEVWTYLVLNHPELNPTIEHPISQYGNKVMKALDAEKKENMIKAVAEKYGVFFFYEGNNKVSQAVVPTVEYLESHYGFKVIAVSADGYHIEKLKNKRTDTGIIKNLNITVYPSLYLVNPVDGKFLPISAGIQSFDQIESNIITQHLREKK
ncbi:MAG: type-F conjugative transfer system pilin assembly protein TraF [Parachlamydiaceae bacterium]